MVTEAQLRSMIERLQRLIDSPCLHDEYDILGLLNCNDERHIMLGAICALHWAAGDKATLPQAVNAAEKGCT